MSQPDLQEILDNGLSEDFPGTIDVLVKKSSAPAFLIRQAIAPFFSREPVPIYWSPVTKQAAVDCRTPEDLQYRYRTVLRDALGSRYVKNAALQPVDHRQGWWVKTAYSKTLRTILEFMKVFPSSKTDTIGGRPIASTIAGGLLGAGLGYGTGWLAEKVLPRSWGLKNRLALLGGISGTALGSVPGLINLHQGYPFNDNRLWKDLRPELEKESPVELGTRYKTAVAHTLDKFAGAYGSIGGDPDAAVIDVDDLGNILWGTKANPQTTAMTLGLVHGASKMPDMRVSSRYVTPHQTGLLGMAMGAAGGGLKGYVTGYAVGRGLGLLTGMPKNLQNKFVQGGTALGVISTLVPKMFQ